MTSDEAMRLAAEHHQAGRLVEAETFYRQILSHSPCHFGAFQGLAILAAQADRTEVAITLMRRAIALEPGSAEAHSNLGNVLRQARLFEDSAAACREALRLNPALVEARNNLGNALRGLGRIEEAIAEYHEVLRDKSDYVDAWNNLGKAYSAIRQFDKAIAAWARTLQLSPRLAEVHYNLGNAFRDRGQFDEASLAYRRALEINPELAEAWNNVGTALQASGLPGEAIDACRRALRLRPDYLEAHSNLGVCLHTSGQIDEAIEEWHTVLHHNPRDSEAHSNLLFAFHYHPAYDSAAILAESLQWARLHAEPFRPHILSHGNDRSPERRLRVGYVSPDFCNHAVGRSILPLFEQRDRRQFEVFCYANVLSPDALTEKLRSATDHWRDIRHVPDEGAADLIRNDRIDILVDLALHSSRNRLLIFARKPAPVQVSYLGYCGTTGLAEIDYRLSDPYMDPPGGEQECYSEQTVRLPSSYWCYQPAGHAPEVPPLATLSRDCITFGCLNNFAKVSSAALDLWIEILRAVPRSRLLLQAPAGCCREDVLRRFAHHELSSDRVEFVGRQPWEQYLQSYQEIDLALDPFPFGGGITTCDALWMGVPVVTLSGRTAVGRGGRSILSNIGLPELVAETPQQYVEIAVALANDLPRLSELRRTLRQRMEHSPLRDAKWHTREIEGTYRQMWRTWCASEAG